MKYTTKISFKNKSAVKGDVLFVSINPKNTDEIVREGGVKTLYMKSPEEISLRKFFTLVRKVVVQAKSAKAKKLAIDVADFKFKNLKLTDEELGEILGSHIPFANYEFLEYKSDKEKKSKMLDEVIFINTNNILKSSIQKGVTIADEVNSTRTLANTPGGDMTPKILANKAKEAVKGLPVKVKVMSEKEMKQKGMRAILAVGQGSTEESQFIIMEYSGGKKNEKPIVLVGKGVTFDTGGINLKPSNSLLGMNMDMSGGASVIHTIALVAKMKLKKNVIALIPSVENMASGESYRPGDVIRSYSGQTIEVLNTDAEGRVIMADALYYAQQYKPELVIDVATLTGAACVALGEKASALFTEDDKVADEMIKAGESTGDYAWRLPLWEEYEEEIKGSLGDWTNVHNKDSRYGGAIYAASFLHQFIKPHKWAHIDMAPRMTSTNGDYLASGAAGAPVRLLYKFIENSQ